MRLLALPSAISRRFMKAASMRAPEDLHISIIGLCAATQASPERENGDALAASIRPRAT